MALSRVFGSLIRSRVLSGKCVAAGNHYRNDYRTADWRKEMFKVIQLVRQERAVSRRPHQHLT